MLLCSPQGERQGVREMQTANEQETLDYKPVSHGDDALLDSNRQISVQQGHRTRVTVSSDRSSPVPPSLSALTPSSSPQDRHTALRDRPIHVTPSPVGFDWTH